MSFSYSSICIVFYFLASISIHVSAQNDSVVKRIDSIITTDQAHFALKQTEDLFGAPNESDTAEASVFPDMHFEYRIEQIAKQTPIPMEYNDQVKNYISAFLTKRKNELGDIVGLSALYFPVFEENLAKYNLPLELKYLAIVESSLNPLAVSKSGATGLWQILFHTSKMLDLQITTFVDERKDARMASDAACRYLQYLYGIFNDWQLAIAAYNSGPGDIRNAMIRSGNKTNFWELQPYLPEQTKNYVPAFIAATYIMTYYKEHDILPVKPEFTFEEIAAVQLSNPVSFDAVSRVLGISIETLRYLNPAFTKDIIPLDAKRYSITLPTQMVSAFVKNESKIYSNTKQNSMRSFYVNDDSKVKVEHVVQKGEFLHKIAMKYNCSVDEITSWNNLANTNLQPGQKLIIWTNPISSR